jgi:carbonic anhydrase
MMKIYCCGHSHCGAAGGEWTNQTNADEIDEMRWHFFDKVNKTLTMLARTMSAQRALDREVNRV